MRRLPLLLTAGIVIVLALVASLVVVAGRADHATEVASDLTQSPVTPSATRSAVVDRTTDRQRMAEDRATRAPAKKNGTKAAKKHRKPRLPAYNLVQADRPIRKYTQKELAVMAERRAALLAAPKTSTFRIASLNILGSNHKGNGLGRASQEATLLKNRGVDIVGMQEVQRDQRRVFLNQMPAYTMWPQDAVGRQGYRKQILWRSDRFEMLDGGSVNAPFTGMSVPVPYVLLRDRASGAEFWVVDSHNSPQGRQGERNVATGIQVDLINRLNDTHPVLLVGDMNEHETWFCRFASQVPAWSANGGYYSGGCHPPGRPLRLDWIVGSATGDNDVDFSGYAQDGTTKATGMSDHFLVYATAKVSYKAPPSTDTAAGTSD